MYNVYDSIEKEGKKRKKENGTTKNKTRRILFPKGVCPMDTYTQLYGFRRLAITEEYDRRIYLNQKFNLRIGICHFIPVNKYYFIFHSILLFALLILRAKQQNV